MKYTHKLLMIALLMPPWCNAMFVKSPEVHDLKSCCLFTEEGVLTVITGPMYSGKTENLIMYAKSAREQGLKYMAFKHAFDIRTANTLKSRALIEEVPCIATQLSEYILRKVAQESPKVVFIDEVQFFSVQLIDAIDRMLKAHINVVVSGLDTNFRREPFGTIIPQLLVRAQNKIFLQAKCNVCNEHNAQFTQRLVDGKPALRSTCEIVLDGCNDSMVTYEPRCHNCHQIGNSL